MRAAIVDRGITIESADDLGGALGTSAGGRIQILNGLSAAQEFVVLVHEYAHELLHRADDRPASRDTRELEAEAVAFVVGDAVGLNTSDASREYIHLYRGDREALASSLDRIQRATSVILTAVGPPARFSWRRRAGASVPRWPCNPPSPVHERDDIVAARGPCGFRSKSRVTTVAIGRHFATSGE